MGAFLDGKQSYRTEMVSNVVEKDSEKIDPRLPLIDHRSQMIYRRRLVLDGLDKTLLDILKLLKISPSDISTDLKDLVDGQGERIEDLEKKVEELLEQVREERSEAEGTKQEIAKINERLDIRDVRTEEMFEKLTLQNKTIGDEMLIQKVVFHLNTP